ncbi:MAG: hypothetical protein ORN98_10810 [Alphaproteobacteria bacterium]|nr:hypothetical protein [Alphaproteobacteria bacterium]
MTKTPEQVPNQNALDNFAIGQKLGTLEAKIDAVLDRMEQFSIETNRRFEEQDRKFEERLQQHEKTIDAKLDIMLLMTKENSQRISNLEQTVTRLAENVAELSAIIRYQDKRQHEFETKMDNVRFHQRWLEGGVAASVVIIGLFSWLMRGIIAKF